MTISDQGWATIRAYEASNFAKHRAIEQSTNLLVSTMITHLKNCHGMGEKKIAQSLNIERSFVRRFLKSRKEAV